MDGGSGLVQVVEIGLTLPTSNALLFACLESF
jgi:hypothetical protein